MPPYHKLVTKLLNTSKVVLPRCPASRGLYESEWTNHKDGVANAKTALIYLNDETGLPPDFDVMNIYRS